MKQCEDGEIRLSDGVSEYTGRVEICYDTEWGTLCSDGADQSIATKVCTTLNFDGDGKKICVYIQCIMYLHYYVL